MKPAILFVPFLWISLIAQVQFYPAQRPPLPTQNQTGKASIEGSVIDAITHEPVKKATIMLNGQVGLSAVTDASGHFAFRQLPAGQYTIQATSEKYPFSQFSFELRQFLSISLAADEQKQDISVSLTPGASVRGRIVDEEGNPMSGCNVAAMQFRDMGMGRSLQQSSSSQIDEKGEYRISNLPSGKYYIQARCFKTIPLPHAFVRRASIMDVPRLTYAPLFYPAAADPVSAAKVQASPGADISGVDFRMVPARGVTVRGHAGPSADRNIQLSLTPKDPTLREFRTQGARVNSSTGEFQIQNVLPGSYDLVATATDEGRSYFAKVSVEVGDVPLDPIDLTLAVAPTVSGTISIEGDTKVPMNNMHVMLNPLEFRAMMVPPPQAEVQSDGTFLVNSVMPGRWRLNVNGMPGYVKSVQQGDQEVSPWDLEIGSSPSQLKILVGAKYAKVEATLSASTEGAGQIGGILWAANGDPNFRQNFSINTQNSSTLQVPPGKYHVCAFAAVQPGMLMQNGALRKALESHCETVEAPEGGKTQVQVPVIPAADLQQMLEKIEE
jgi:hypothetical protein